MKYIDIRFEFEVDQEALEEEAFECYDLKSIRRLDTNIKPEPRQGIVEDLAQSDAYWTEYAWKILSEFERER